MAGPDHTIQLADSGERCTCRDGETLLAALERAVNRGILARGERTGARIPVGCRQGGCGVCRVQVLSGPYRLGPMSRSGISDADLQNGVALACRLVPEGDLSLRLAPRKSGGMVAASAA